MHSDLNTPSSTDSSSSELPKTFRLNKREEISEDYGDPELLFLSEEEYDEAIIGVAHRIGQDDVIAYDYNKLCEIVAKMMGNDDIGCEAIGFHCQGRFEACLPSDGFGFKI